MNLAEQNQRSFYNQDEMRGMSMGGKQPYLAVQATDFLLTLRGEQEIIHLLLEGVIHFDVNVIASGFLGLCPLHTATTIADNEAQNLRGV